MLPKLYSVFSFGLIIMTASCGNIYQNPPKDPVRTAILRSEATRSGVFTWTHVTVEAVNDKAINYLTAVTTESKEIVVPAGNQNVVLAGTFNQAFGGAGPFEARGDLTINFKPGMDYKANGRVHGSKMLLWIEDTKTGKPASKVLEVPYQSMPRYTSTPIFIPASN